MSNAASFTVNSFDAVVLTVVGLSALVAFFRGFVRELLSLGAWVGAAIVTMYLFPHSTEFMKEHIHGHQSAAVSAGIGALGTYIAALFCFAILNSLILKYLKTGAEVGLLDNFLGFIFGALRGAFIVSLGYLILASTIDKDNPPDWLKKSFTKKYAEEGANLLANVAPKYLHDVEGFLKSEKDKAKEERDNPDSIELPQPGKSDVPDSGELKQNFRQMMNQPIKRRIGTYGNE